MGSRVYVGNLSSRVTERDLEHFFKGFGRIRDVMMKSGFGFVEFEDSRDADDAVHEQNGRDLMGSRVVVEVSRRRFGYGRRDGGRDDGGYRDGGVMTRDGRVNGRYPPPMQTRYRMLVTNLSTRCSWQDIKDMMRMDGKVNVTYADAHKRARNEALLCFATHDDLRRAMDKFQGKEINGRRIKIVDDSDGGGGRRSRSRSPRSRSRSRSPRSRSRSRSARRSRSRSRSARRSRSRSPPSRSRSRSNSSKGSRGSRAKNGRGDEVNNRKRSRSRTASSASSRGSHKNDNGGEKKMDED